MPDPPGAPVPGFPAPAPPPVFAVPGFAFGGDAPPRWWRPSVERCGGVLPHKCPEPGVGGGFGPTRHPLQGGRGHQILRPS